MAEKNEIFDRTQGDGPNQPTSKNAQQEPEAAETGELFTPSNPNGLYAELGERVQDVLGKTDTKAENRISPDYGTQRTDPVGSGVEGNVRPAPETRINLDAQPDRPIIPQGAFAQGQNVPTPDSTESVPSPDNETTPYGAQEDTGGASEGGKVRGWSTGVGEQEGGTG